MTIARSRLSADNSAALLAPLIAPFQPVSLAEIQASALQDRVDTKYVISICALCQVLQQVTSEYRVLEINGVRLNRYRTLYFDTPDFALYRQHHNGFGSRYKVRERCYVDSNLAFLEIKHRTNRARTIKSRIPIPDIALQIDGVMDDFVSTHMPFPANNLEPKLWNDYTRITLVSKKRVERVTLDLNVRFSWGDVRRNLPGIAIVEIKQDRLSSQSEFVFWLRRMGIRPMSYSKYAAGVYMLYQGVKLNNFKPQILQMNKMLQKAYYHATH